MLMENMNDCMKKPDSNRNQTGSAGLMLLLFVVIGLSACSVPRRPYIEQISIPPKGNDLVLVHGLLNKHHWGEAFLDVCLKVWGSGNVYLVYTNPSTRIWTRTINGRKAYCIGENDHTAGTESIQLQVNYLDQSISALQKNSGLGAEFDVIAHSMGGLVTRRYIYLRPGTVAGLVTLGTPHHGSPLADSFGWAGFFLGAANAVSDLRPEFISQFNQAYPVPGSPMHNNGKVYTIRGGCPDGDCHGWGGELSFGWDILKYYFHTDSDGLVPEASALADGAEHIADFPDFDHYELVFEPAVALKAAEKLP